MQFHRTRPRHAVIDQDGNAVDDTVRLPRLRFVLGGQMSARLEGLESLPVSRLLHDGHATRTLPVHGAETVVMRVPAAPRPRRAAELVRVGFAMAARELDQLVAVLSSGWRKAAAENDQRMQRLDARLADLVARQHAWAAAEDGRALEEAYRQGGTERLLKLTPTVLAAMDARAKSTPAGVAR